MLKPRLPSAEDSCSAPPSDGAYHSVASLQMCLYRSDVTDTWYRARVTCLRKGGDLLRLSDRAAHAQIHSVLQGDSGSNRTRFLWVGLYRGGFYWDDGR